MSDPADDRHGRGSDGPPEPVETIVSGDYILTTADDEGFARDPGDVRLESESASEERPRPHAPAARRSVAREAGSGGAARRAGRIAMITLGVGVLLVVVLAVAITAVNGFARWNARRAAARQETPTAAKKESRGNVLLVSEKQGRADGFLALRVDEGRKQVFGIAIPSAAFLEVPGQGFERVGDSYLSGPKVSLAAISNFLSVPFERYLVVPVATYQKVLRAQNMRGVVEAASKSNLSEQEAGELAKFLDRVPTKNVALVPLEVKPITVGSQTYFEPQRDALADLLESWWGVKLGEIDDVVRVIVYNGVGTPGVAGEAAQQLIRSGFRVVDTKNADTFDYAKTQVVVQHKDMTAGKAVKKALGTGQVVNQPSDQDVADVIVIVGKDYRPTGKTTGP